VNGNRETSGGRVRQRPESVGAGGQGVLVGNGQGTSDGNQIQVGGVERVQRCLHAAVDVNVGQHCFI